MMELKTAAALAGYPPCHEPANSGAWTVAAEQTWAALGGSGNVPEPAQVMGIGMGQPCWGTKSSSRRMGIF